MAADSTTGEQDLFKETFKRYKKNTASDFGNVIDVRTPDRFTSELREFSTSESSTPVGRFGLRPVQEWKLYRLNSIPGLVVIPNPFLPGAQLHWMAKCLVEYPCKPNICNLDAHTERSGDGRLWLQFNSSSSSPTSSSTNLLCGQTRPDADVAEREEVHVKKRMKLSERDSLVVSKSSELYKLRWVTLGYQYDWNSKEYYRDRWSPFPVELAEMSATILEVCGFPNFCAEAGIVNYYHLDSTLSGHTDHSEKDLSQPLLSLSFGQSAIFLIGGPTKQVNPKALLLNSGDIVVMSGESRLAYHGVPKVLPPQSNEAGRSDSKTASLPECLSKGVCEAYLETGSTCNLSCKQTIEAMDSSKRAGCDQNKTQTSQLADKRGCPCCQELIKTWQLFESYVSMSRINVNVRQVISDKCSF